MGRGKVQDAGAYNQPLGTQGSARSDVESGMWRGGVSPLGSGARTRPVKAVIVGRATAESPGAGCGADRDRMTSVHSRGSSGKPLAALDQGLGQ